MMVGWPPVIGDLANGETNDGEADEEGTEPGGQGSAQPSNVREARDGGVKDAQAGAEEDKEVVAARTGEWGSPSLHHSDLRAA
jgi:hypothetical protein